MKLKLQELVELKFELNGVPEKLQGLLRQKLSLKAKVYIQRLNKFVDEEVKIYEELRMELFKKYGKESEGQLVVPSENVTDFAKELQELNSVEKEISVSDIWGGEFKLDDISSIETEEVYTVFMKLLDEK